jgi:hypothetical protein
MRTKYMLVALSGAIATGFTLGCAASAEPSSQAEPTAEQSFAVESSPGAGQARIADTTLKLEKAFNDQFVKGQIDRSALAAPIADVIQAMPEEARPKVQAHLDEILKAADTLAPKMSPEERAQAVQPPAEEHVGKTQQAQIAAWGWPGYGGWGGYGAFGFPGMYGYGTGYGTGYGVGYGTGYGVGYGAYGAGYGAGLGWGGLGWGGLGMGGLGWGGLGLGWGGLGLGGWYW